MSVELSIVVPIYNEESNIDHLLARLLATLNKINTTYEIICVNDGSQDNSLNCLVDYHKRIPAIKIINLSRNFGKEIALTCGLDYASGAAVIPIDADLQHPPELIEELVTKWREGNDVVYATRKTRREESWLKRLTAHAFYQVIGQMSSISIPPNAGDFRLLDRRVVDALKQIPERNRFMKGLFSWVGYKQTSILFDVQPRFQGKTTWNYCKLWNLAIGGLTSFSLIPLKISSYIGLFTSLVSLVYAGFLIVYTLITGIEVPGYASTIVAVLFLGGIQLITLGIIGEYLGRVYEEVKQRPLYLVRDYYGIPPKKER